MKVYDFDLVKKWISNTNPQEWVKWVDFALRHKEEFVMPAKTRIDQAHGDYYAIMSAENLSLDVAMVKMIGRHSYSGNRPGMLSDMLLYRAGTGELLGLMDGDYITTIRTGAVAAHSALLFAKSNFHIIGLIGLGNIMVATLKSLVSSPEMVDQKLTIKLYRHHGQENRFKQIFQEYKNINFKMCGTYSEVISNSELIFSAVTQTDENFADDCCFAEGCTVVPISTKGFQNCDLFFDKVFADEINQIRGFKYFSKFKSLANVSDVLTGERDGRSNDRERVLVYNYGLAIHDLFFAAQLLKRCEGVSIPYQLPSNKFYM